MLLYHLILDIFNTFPPPPPNCLHILIASATAGDDCVEFPYPKFFSAFIFPVWTSYSVCDTSVPMKSIKVGFLVCLFLPEQFPDLLSVCVYNFCLLVDPTKLFTVHAMQQVLVSICFLTLNSWRSQRWKDEPSKIMTIWEVIKQETPLHCDWKEMSGCQPSELFHMNQAIMGLFFMCLKGGLRFIL